MVESHCGYEWNEKRQYMDLHQLIFFFFFKNTLLITLFSCKHYIPDQFLVCYKDQKNVKKYQLSPDTFYFIIVLSLLISDFSHLQHLLKQVPKYNIRKQKYIVSLTLFPLPQSKISQLLNSGCHETWESSIASVLDKTSIDANLRWVRGRVLKAKCLN